MSFRRRAPLVASATFVLCCLSAAPLASQDVAGQDGDDGAWLTGGIGKGTEGIAAVAGVNVASAPHILSFRTATTGPVLDGGETFWDAGLLYGRALRWPEGLAAASAGVGVMGGHRTDDHLSVPVAARVSWHLTSWLGFGAYGFVNINREQPFGGVTLSMELGLLR